jgi:hypothetical protein
MDTLEPWIITLVTAVIATLVRLIKPLGRWARAWLRAQEEASELEAATREWTAWRQCIAGVALPCTSAGMVECLAVQP